MTTETFTINIKYHSESSDEFKSRVKVELVAHYDALRFGVAAALTVWLHDGTVVPFVAWLEYDETDGVQYIHTVEVFND